MGGTAVRSAYASTDVPRLTRELGGREPIAPRNPVRGPGYRNLDLAVMRRVPLSGTKALEVRAEVFNVTNTPPFLAPNTTAGSAAFGTITAAGDPRVVQLALKFFF
jgi:outer membrane receptor protein involved in Fe transport